MRQPNELGPDLAEVNRLQCLLAPVWIPFPHAFALQFRRLNQGINTGITLFPWRR
jgi:hypothetical protein